MAGIPTSEYSELEDKCKAEIKLVDKTLCFANRRDKWKATRTPLDLLPSAELIICYFVAFKCVASHYT